MDKQNIAVAETIYREHKDHIYNYIHRMCNDPQLSQDIVQTTFIKVLCDEKVAQVEHVKAYLFTIARNTLFDEMKRKKPVYFDDSEQMQEIAQIDDDVSLQTETEEKVLAAAIGKAITNLPEKFRELMLLRYTEDLTIQEIADITGRKLSDIKVNLHRARLSFENRFTATMYSKVAASRQRCETLINMIAPFGEGDIPFAAIPRIEMHIADCAECNEDATQMKRRRELFAFLPILVAPGLWEDIMKEAQASTLTESNADPSSLPQTNDTKTSNSQTSETPISASQPNLGVSAEVTAKLTMAKLLTIAAVSIIIVTSGIVILYISSEELEEQAVPPVVTDTVQSPANVPTPPAPPVPSSQPPSQPPSQSTPLADTSQAPNQAPRVAQVDQDKIVPPTQASVQQQSKPQPSQQVAKLSEPAIDKSKPEKTAPQPVVEAKTKPKDSESPFWLYGGPPLIATEETIYDTEKTVSTMYLSQFGSRSEEQQDPGRNIVVIVNFEKHQGWMVNTNEKVYVNVQLDDEGNSKIMPSSERDNRMSNLYDTKPCRQFDKSIQLGTETIAGYAAEKWGCEYSRTRDRTIQWYAPDIGIIVAEENDSIGKETLTEISLQSIDKSLYQLPEGFKEVSLDEFAILP